MTSNGQTEVLVVGGGPVGLLTALLSVQHGLKTRIIDQESRTATKSYACALHPGSLGILERAGILKDAIQLGRRVEHLSLYEGHECRAQTSFSGVGGQFPFVVVLAQFLLEELLEHKLRAAGVQVEWNRRLREIKQGGTGVEVWIEKLAPSGRGYIIPELEFTVQDRFSIQADYVVGADGHNSLLRQQLGIGSARAGPPLLFGIYEIETEEPLGDEMKLVLQDAGLSVLWPLADKKCRWSFQIVPPDAAADFPQKDRNRLIIVQAPSDWDSCHHLWRFLVERAPWFKHDIKEIVWVAHAQFERQLVHHYGQGRCWLAGDAAHQASPAGMQSMNMGLSEAAGLADAIKSILRDHGDADSLRAYETFHHNEWTRLLGLARDAAPPAGLSPWAREHFQTIVSNLPASGDDLSRLMEKL